MPRILLAALLMFGAPAYAQDPLDDLPEAGTDDLPEAESEDDLLPEVDDEEIDLDDEEDEGFDLDEPDGDDLEFTDDEDGDLFEDESDPDSVGEGEDTAAQYRARLDELKDLSAEERLAGWEDYLQQFPNSAFREQIGREITQAESEMYGDGIATGTVEKVSKRQLLFPEATYGENLNPATRIKAGFDWGLPEWINLMADAELALSPQFSAHAGMRKRYQGWAFELGPRFALLKSESSGTLLTVAADAHLGVNPGLVGLRPTLGFGQRVGDKLYLQAQASPEWITAEGYWTFFGYANGAASYRVANAVAIFVEGSLAAQHFGWPGGTLAFHTVGFGMRFYPGAKGVSSDDKTDVALGAAVPMYWNYWKFHEGAATVQTNFYLD